ncbi:MAG: hypothetical protein ACK5Y2_05340 [Bdellovibrionales bacterium]
MKHSNSSLLRFPLIVAFAWALGACTPEDNFLGPSNSSTRTQNSGPGGSTQIGSYGLPIFVAQNLEQLGGLWSLCSPKFSSPSSEVQPQSRLNPQECAVEVGPDLTDPAVTPETAFSQEKWKLVRTSEEGAAREQIQGNLELGLDQVQFRNQTIQMLFDQKSFQISRNSNQLQIQLNAVGVFRLTTVNLPFAYRIEADATESFENQQRRWTFSNVTYRLNMLSQDLQFQGVFEQLQLSWLNSQCADFEGKSKVESRKDRTTAVILLQTKGAVLEGGPRPWRRSFKNCQEQREPRRHFEFLFY